MNNSIFDRWFNSEFVPLVRKNLRPIGIEEKAILVLDNAHAHLKFLKEANVHHFGLNIKFDVFLPAKHNINSSADGSGSLRYPKEILHVKLMHTALNELNEEKTMIEVKRT